MRIYDSCVEMLDETYREIWKRGQTIFDKTVQGKIVGEKDYEQREIIFYNFRVDKFDDVEQMLKNASIKFQKPHLSLEVAKQWLADMISNASLHETWWDLNENTKEYFKKFCDEGDGWASYSYGERIIPQLDATITRLKANKYARGAIISMPLPKDAKQIGRRQPCTVSYHFICRPTRDGDKLNLIVNMRSADALNFFPLDFAKSTLFLQWMAKEVGLDVGYVIMNVDSLHVYAIDVPEEYHW
jgi:thymidylate synthase